MRKIKILILSTFFVLPNLMYGIVGLGFNVVQDGGAKIGTAEYQEGEGLLLMTMETFELETSPIGFGGYIFIDLAGWAVELEANAVGALYKMDFSNVITSYDSVSFGWGRGSTAITIKKNIADFSIPLLAKTALSVGVGINTHSSTPKASPSMIKELTGSDDIINAEFTEEKLINYLKENKIDASGIHAQLGLRFKVLIADAHLNFRYNIAENVYDGSDNFTEIQFKLGIGF